MDSLTMPPIIDTEEERRKREEAAVGTRMPAVPLAQPPARSSAFPAAPLSQPDDAGWRKAVHPGEEANQVHPMMPPVKAAAPVAAPVLGASAMPAVPLGPSAPPAHPTEPPAATPTAMPPVTGKAEMAAPSPAVQPGAMPPVPVGPAQQRFEDLNKQGPPQPKWWQRALEIAGSVAPFGLAVEKQLPQTPIGYNAALNKAGLAAAKEQTIGKGQQEAESATAKAQFATPEKRRAYLQQHPNEFEGASDFQKNDFILAGKFPQKEPAEPKPETADKETFDWLVKQGKTPDQALEIIRGAGKPDKPESLAAPDRAVYDSLIKKGMTPEAAYDWLEKHRKVGNSSSVDEGGIKDIGDAIIHGDQPPTLQGMYRQGAAVRAYLATQGFNLARAEQDWKATEKHLSTLNGAQQERLRQAVSFTSDSLGIIEGLYDQWQKTGKTSQWKVFNKASLATAKQLPGEAGNIAHRLEAQINDLTSELGTVYKGGNSSTDESLKLASKNLEADWNEKTFKDSIGQIRQNLDIRQNSIRHSQPAGVSANSPYTPTNEKPTEPPREPREGMKWQQNKKSGEFREVPIA